MAMLGAECSACCSRCGCVHGKLPYTMTVTLAGLENKTHGNYCDLSITSCYGGGAAGVATAPGGCNGNADTICGTTATLAGGKCDTETTYSASNRGPLSGVLLTESGSGYAKIGRVAPTLKATASPGIDAEFTVSMTQSKDSCGLDYWAVSSISVTGGVGYVNGAVLISALAGDTTALPASATIQTDQGEPTLTASVSGGTGAAFNIYYWQTGIYPSTWGVSGVSVASGGTGYANGEVVSFALGTGDTQDTEAIATVSVVDGSIESVSVSDPGRYYKEGVPTYVYVSDGGKYWREDADATPYAAEITVKHCGGGLGAKISATVDTSLAGGRFGEITALTVDDGGTDYLAWKWIDTCRSEMNGIPFVLRATNPIKLVTLSLESCYGSGATASVVPVGPRTEPGVCVKGGGRHGTITPTVTKETDDDGFEYWTISSVSASGGYGYTNNEAATVTFKPAATSQVAPTVTLQATGVTAEDPPNAKNDGVLTGATVVNGGKFYVQHEYDGTPGPIKKVQIDSAGSNYARLGRQEPTLAFSGSGSGATFTPAFKSQKDKCDLDYWLIESVSVTGGGGSGYVDGEQLAITLATANDKSDAAGQARVYTREIPTVTAKTASVSGSGASFSVTLTKSDDVPRTWAVSGVTLTGGGSGYSGSVPVAFTVGGSGTKVSNATATATADNTGAIASVTLGSGGSYYLDSGKAVETKTTAGGHYYRENKSLAPYVADVTVTVNQTLPSAGSGATITATVEGSTGSDKFGQITKLTVTEGGSDYQILGGPLDCTYYGPCGIGLEFRGNGKPAELTFGDAVFRTDQVLGDCNTLPTSASVLHSIGEGSVTLAAGGAWDNKVACPCRKDTICTPCVSASPCKQNTCPPCTGECNACNKCASGCTCDGGNCVACCGPCDEENPCPEGCFCVDGACNSSPCSGPCPDGTGCAPGCVCEDGQCVQACPGCAPWQTVTVWIESDLPESPLTGEYTLNLTYVDPNCSGAMVWSYDGSSSEMIDCAPYWRGYGMVEVGTGVQVSLSLQPGYGGAFINASGRYPNLLGEAYHHRLCCVNSNYACFEANANVLQVIWDPLPAHPLPDGYNAPADWFCDGVEFDTGEKNMSVWGPYEGVTHYARFRASG